jgi:hypothetical protein
LNRLNKRLVSIERRNPTDLERLTDEQLDARIRQLLAEQLDGGMTLDEVKASVPRGLGSNLDDLFKDRAAITTKPLDTAPS